MKRTKERTKVKSLPKQPYPKPVLDASPAIGLSKIGMFSLLERLFGKVAVAEAVYNELLAKGDSPGAPEIKQAIEAGWVEVVVVEASSSFSNLGAGEAATLTLASKTNALALLDDLGARSHASAHRLPVSGTLTVLIHAKRKGFVEAIEPLLHELQKRGFRLSDEVIQDALAKAGERCRSDKSG